MTSDEYAQYIDDFELDVDVMPGESLTDYIERRRREFESKADGGSIGIEVLFKPKRGEYQTGGQAYDSRATAQDFANALKSVSAGTTYQQQADAKRYARNEANRMLTDAFRSGNQQGIQNLYNQFGFNTTAPGSQLFSRGTTSGTLNQIIGLSAANRDRVLDQMAQRMLSYPTGGSSAPDPFKKRIDELEKIKAENQRIVNQYIQNNPPSMGIITGPMGGAAPSPGKPAYEDKTLLSQLTKLTPEQATYFDPFEQLSDIDQYNLAQVFPNLKSQLRNPNFVSSSGPLDKQQIFERMYGLKDGGRVPMVSGGFLKGLASLFKGGDKAADLAKQEEIFRSGPITKEFLETVDSKVINPFVRSRDAKGVGSYGLYDNFDDMPAGLKAAEIIKRFVDRKTGKINYDAAEFFIGRKLKGNETIDELIEIAISKPIGMGKGPFKDFEEYVLKGEKKADGGRVGLFMGGPALEGQALSIYDSMSAYGFSDQQIADALSARGLYTPAGSGSTQPEQVTGIINQQIQTGGGDDRYQGGGKFGNLDITDVKTFQKDVYNAKTGQFEQQTVTGYKNPTLGNYQTFDGKNINHAGINFKPAFAMALESLGVGPKKDAKGFYDGQIAGTFTGFKPEDFKDITGFLKAKKSRQIFMDNQKKAIDAAERERLRIEAEKINAAISRAESARQYDPNIHGPTNYGLGSDGKQSFDSGMGFGINATTGGPVSNKTGKGRTDYSKGGLATMFTRRR